MLLVTLSDNCTALCLLSTACSWLQLNPASFSWLHRAPTAPLMHHPATLSRKTAAPTNTMCRHLLLAVGPCIQGIWTNSSPAYKVWPWWTGELHAVPGPGDAAQAPDTRTLIRPGTRAPAHGRGARPRQHRSLSQATALSAFFLSFSPTLSSFTPTPHNAKNVRSSPIEQFFSTTKRQTNGTGCWDFLLIVSKLNEWGYLIFFSSDRG